MGSLIGYLGKSLTKYFAEISTSLFVSTSAILSIFVFGTVFKITFMETISFLNGLVLEGSQLTGQLISTR